MAHSTPAPSLPKISVVVPTYHRPEALRETLAALWQADYPRDSYELIVVDDGADSLTSPIVDRFATGTWAPKLVQGEGRGAASARNLGAREARNDFVLFCDDDIIVDPDHLLRHMTVQKMHGPCLCGGFITLDERVIRLLSQSCFGRYRLKLQDAFSAVLPSPTVDGVAEIDLLSACDLSLPRAGFEELGGFDENFPFAGAEDQDLSMRARRLDFSRLLDHRNRVRHLETWIDFPYFCQREERGAQTYAVLARKFPESAGRSDLARVNDPAIRHDDGWRLRSTKRIKRGLGRERTLSALHGLVRRLERARAPDPIMRRLYSGVISVHMARGYRDGLARNLTG